MNENRVVIFPYAKSIHILGDGNITLCRKKTPRGSKIYNYDPLSGLNYCEKCLLYVGKEMLGEYLGQIFFEEPESQEETKKRTDP